MKPDIFGYIIMENVNEFAEVSNLDVVKQNGLFYIRFDTVLQSLNVVNRNKRWYAQDGIKKGLESDRIQELIANGRFEGEAGHPITEDIARVSTIDPGKTCHKILKYWFEGNLLKATVETLDDGMLGTKLTKRILQGGRPSFSLRALARLDKEKNISYVRTTPHIVTYDEVILPSHKEAYGVLGSEKKVIKGVNGKEFVMENGAIELSTTDVKSYVERKSDNLNIICESFGVTPDAITVIGGGKQLAVSEKGSGEKFVFALEQTVADNIRDYWTRF